MWSIARAEDKRRKPNPFIAKGVQMISEQSAGRGFEALLPPKVPPFGEPCGAIYIYYIYIPIIFFM